MRKCMNSAVVNDCAVTFCRYRPNLHPLPLPLLCLHHLEIKNKIVLIPNNEKILRHYNDYASLLEAISEEHYWKAF